MTAEEHDHMQELEGLVKRYRSRIVALKEEPRIVPGEVFSAELLLADELIQVRVTDIRHEDDGIKVLVLEADGVDGWQSHQTTGAGRRPGVTVTTATSPATPASREALDDVLAIADELELMDCHRLAARLREAAALLTAVIRPSTV